MTKTVKCEICKKSFKQNHHSHKYCSDKCRSKRAYEWEKNYRETVRCNKPKVREEFFYSGGNFEY